MDYMALRRTWWHRVKMSLRGCQPRLSLRLCLFEEEFCLDLFGFLIALPFLDRWHREPHEMMESWGVYYDTAAVVWCCGDYCKFYHMPWDYRHFITESLRPDGTWVKQSNDYREPYADGRWTATYDYSYTLRSGEVQERTAQVYVDRRQWRQRWLYWCPWFAKVRQSLDYTFSDEVGERTGSWKGGVISSGITMLNGETAEQSFRRMERDRVFD